jgi:hypothetical protein
VDVDREYERVLQRVTSPAPDTQGSGDLAALRDQIEEWTALQDRNEEAGRFDWNLGRQLLTAKRQFSLESVHSSLHNPDWCRTRDCPAPACGPGRRRQSGSLAGLSKGTVRAHQVDSEAVWGAFDERPSRWWSRWWWSKD